LPFNFTNILPQTLPSLGDVKFAKLMSSLPNLFAIPQTAFATKASQLVLEKKSGKNVGEIAPMFSR
jgi:hypothetical protein